jgi:Big-like domain-containing protein/polysaccharide deacetylase
MIHTQARATTFARATTGLAIALLLLLVIGRASVHAATNPVVVSLEFDDGTADQAPAQSLLSSHGVHGVFFINSGRIGTPGYLSLTQIHSIAADGNEIGGHTVSHADVPTLDLAEQQRQVCNDRVALLNEGFHVTDFAFPFGDNDAQSESVVQGCNYNSGRDIGGIVSAGSCSGCDYAEWLPSPRDLWATRTPDSVKSYTTVSDLTGYVTAAQAHGGGWVQLVVHHLCSGSSCDTLSADPGTISAFLDWLNANNIRVATIQDMLGSAEKAPVNGPPPTAGTLQNGSLELPATGDLPTCWKRTDIGSAVGTGARTADAHSGSFGYTLNATSVPSGGAVRLYSTQDLGTCAPPADAGQAYQMGVWYKTTAPTVRLVAYYRNSQGGWAFGSQSPLFSSSSSWKQFKWTTPALTAGTTGISVLMSLQSVGSVTFDDFSLTNAANDSTPPTITLTSPADGSTVSGNVVVSATAADDVGVKQVDFFAGGNPIGSDTTAPYSVTWDSSTSSQSVLGITATAIDFAGNPASASANVTIEDAPPPPSASNLLYNPSLEELAAGSSTVPDCWQQGGFGTNTATWTRSSDAHSGAYAQSVAITSLTDGDRKLVVDQRSTSCAPAVAAGATYKVSGWYKSSVPVRFATYTRNASTGAYTFWQQSGFFPASSSYAEATFTTAAVPATTDAVSFGFSITQVGSMTVDDMGMTQATAPPPPPPPSTDTTPPTASLGAPADGATVSGSVSLQATADDDTGVTRVDFLDGATLIGSSNAGPYATSWDTTKVVDGSHSLTAVAYDAAGNQGASTAVTVTVHNAPPPDTTAPSVTVSSPTGGSVTGTVTITATATDNVGVTKVELLAGTTLVGTATSSPYSAQWDTTNVPSGVVALTAKAYDAAGNSTTSAAVSVTVTHPDTVAPLVAITSPADGSNVSGQGTTRVTASASDGGGSGLASVAFYVDGTLQATVAAPGPYTFQWNAKKFTKGHHALTAVATDGAGNKTTSSTITLNVT